MDAKQNLKYFKDTGLIFRIGLGILMAGIVLSIIILIIAGHIFAGVYTTLPVLIAGIVVVIFAKSAVLSDREYDEQTKKIVTGIQKNAMDYFELEDRHIKALDPIIFDEYDYRQEDGYLYRKDASGSRVRSSVYMAAILMFGFENMYVYVNRVSMIEEENPYPLIHEVYKYTDLSRAELAENEITYKVKENTVTTKFYSFKLISNDGREIISAPAANDALTDQQVADINKLIGKIKSQQN